VPPGFELNNASIYSVSNSIRVSKVAQTSDGQFRLLHRRSFIGGSDARIIMGSDEAALVRLWREKRGEAEPEDLSGNLIVQLGRATEDLNRSWYERNTGRQVRDVQRRVRHSAIAWMAATLDGTSRTPL
jgi:predicted phage-related endonuclease